MKVNVHVYYKLFFYLCRYVKDFCAALDLLISNNVVPVVVFDGNDLPAKQLTKYERVRCVIHFDYYFSILKVTGSYSITQSQLRKLYTFIIH